MPSGSWEYCTTENRLGWWCFSILTKVYTLGHMVFIANYITPWQRSQSHHVLRCTQKHQPLRSTLPW